MNITIIKNPGLGFSVAGGVGLQGNPYKPHDEVRPDQRNSLSLTSDLLFLPFLHWTPYEEKQLDRIR